jgi:hypothetical protein
MSGILDKMLGAEQFVAVTVNHYIALQLAKRMGDEGALNRYLYYVTHHPVERLVRLYHQVKSEADPAATFHSSLIPPKP